MKTQITLLTLSVVLSSCGPSQMKALVTQVTGDNSSQSCKITSSRSLWAEKIQKLNAQMPTPQNSLAPIRSKIVDADFAQIFKSSALLENSVLKKNTNLEVVVDRLCAKQNASSPILKDIQNKLLVTARLDVSADQSVAWKLPTDMTMSALKTLADSISCVKMISPNGNIELTSYTPNDTNYSDLNHLHTIGQPDVYEKLYQNPVSIDNQVIVADIDTGNDMQHEDMQGQFWLNQAEQNGKAGVDDDGNGYIDDIKGWNFWMPGPDVTDFYFEPHGEHVAGLIAAHINNGLGVAGIAAPRVKMMILNIFDNPEFDQDGPDPLGDFLDNAIRYAADNGAQVINLSLGRSGKMQPMEDALKYATDKGVVVVVSAGNNNKEITDPAFPFAPAVYAKDLPGMLAVAATDALPTGDLGRCAFSNFSTTYVSLSAPGCDSSPNHATGTNIEGMLSTSWTNHSGGDAIYQPKYIYMEGTSMASPLVAGAAALVISYIKEKTGIAPTNAVVEDILKKGSRHQDNLDTVTEAGRALDLRVLMNYIDTEILPPIAPSPTPCI